MNGLRGYPRQTVVYADPGQVPASVLAWLAQGAAFESMITPLGWRHSLIEDAPAGAVQ